MKKLLPLLLITALPLCAAAGPRPAVSVPEKAPPLMAPEGKKNPLPGGGWFIWKFDKKPRLGPVIMKVRIYAKDGRQDSSLEVTGEYGMPSMRHHDSGPLKFQKNKKGDYLLPVDIAMSGEWEIAVRIRRGKNQIFRGRTLFDV